MLLVNPLVSVLLYKIISSEKCKKNNQDIKYFRLFLYHQKLYGSIRVGYRLSDMAQFGFFRRLDLRAEKHALILWYFTGIKLSPIRLVPKYYTHRSSKPTWTGDIPSTIGTLTNDKWQMLSKTIIVISWILLYGILYVYLLMILIMFCEYWYLKVVPTILQYMVLYYDKPNLACWNTTH